MKSLVQIRDEISEAEWIGPDTSTIDPVCYQDFEAIFNVGFKHGHRIAQERAQVLVNFVMEFCYCADVSYECNYCELIKNYKTSTELK